MKCYKILIFILSVIFALAIIAAFFPKEGVSLKEISLRFPSLEQVMLREVEVREEMAVQMLIDTIDTDNTLAEEIRDTLTYYKQIVFNHTARFYLPDDDIAFFDDFFEKAEESTNEGEVLRILHYGDSQIEMDRISSVLRSFFQERFGGGGPGLIPLCQQVGTPSVSHSYSGISEDYNLYGTGMKTKDREYGLMGRFYRVHGNNHLTVSTGKNKKDGVTSREFSRVSLIYKDLRGNFSCTLKDKRSGYAVTQMHDSLATGFFTWQLDTPSTRVSMTFNGEADIYGLCFDQGKGVAVDNIPIRGSSGTIFTQIEASSLMKQYEMANVGMIILQFGGNSVPGIGTKGIESYKSRIKSQINYLKSLYPQATILFIGPSDMSTKVNGVIQTYPFLPLLIEALKEVTTENNAAFWNMYEVMGGKNSMISWVNHGLAGSDHVHFTSKGADKIGEALCASFAMMYNFYQIRHTIPEDQFDKVWKGDSLCSFDSAKQTPPLCLPRREASGISF